MIVLFIIQDDGPDKFITQLASHDPNQLGATPGARLHPGSIPLVLELLKRALRACFLCSCQRENESIFFILRTQMPYAHAALHASCSAVLHAVLHAPATVICYVIFLQLFFILTCSSLACM
jgi:hypothetical protein